MPRPDSGKSSARRRVRRAIGRGLLVAVVTAGLLLLMVLAMGERRAPAAVVAGAAAGRGLDTAQRHDGGDVRERHP